jgi:hypothetical protein
MVKKKTTTTTATRGSKLNLKMGTKKLILTEEDLQGVSGGAPSSAANPTCTTCCHCDPDSGKE